MGGIRGLTIVILCGAAYHGGMRTAILLTALLTLATHPLSAQPVEPANSSNAWLGYIVAIGCVVVVIAGSFMSSRRTHQD